MTLLLVTRTPRATSLRSVPCSEPEAGAIAAVAFERFGVEVAGLFGELPSDRALAAHFAAGRPMAELPGLVTLYVPGPVP